MDSVEGGADSLFVAWCNFEPRCTNSLEKLDSGYRAVRFAICLTTDYAQKGSTQDHLSRMMSEAELHSLNRPVMLTSPSEQPLTLVDGFVKEFGEFLRETPAANVTIDMTAFPRQELLVLLRYLDSLPSVKDIRLLYTEPLNYATEERKQDNRWLTGGVVSVCSVPGFSGIQYPRRQKALVVILGHEGERTNVTLKRHQPDKVIILKQSRVQYHEGLSAIAETEYHRIVLQYEGRGLETWRNSLPAHGVEETRIELNKIYEKYGQTFNLFVAPNGTKFQLVGTYLAANQIVDMQITYAVPAIINWEGYSKGASTLWSVSLPR